MKYSSTVDWIVKQAGKDSRVVHIEPLVGGISSVMSSVHIEKHGEPLQWVMRQFTDNNWLSAYPDLAVYETEALHVAEQAGIPSPKWIAADYRGQYCEYPTVLMSHLPGQVELRPQRLGQWLGGLAEVLAELHVNSAKKRLTTGRNYYTYSTVADLQVPAWSRCPSTWKRIIDILQSVDSAPSYIPQFIHRDYHPTNVLWTDGKVSGIVDWVNACMGPVGVDTGHCRVNLVQLYGVEAAEYFLSCYLKCARVSDEVADPYWDMLTLIETLPGPPSVYKGWEDLGFYDLTPDLIASRLDEYAESLINKLK